MAHFETYSAGALSLLTKSAIVDGAMIAFFLEPATALHIALPDGEPINQLHITLYSFGEIDTFTEDLLQADCTPRTLRTTLAGMAGEFCTIEGSVAGVGCFTENPDERPFLALVDIPELHKVHHRLHRLLKVLNIPCKQNHGFTPHITLKYLQPGEPFPLQTIKPVPLRFSGITLAIGKKRYFFPFKEKPVGQKHFPGLHNQQNHGNRYHSVEGVRTLKPRNPGTSGGKPAPHQKATGKAMSYEEMLATDVVKNYQLSQANFKSPTYTKAFGELAKLQGYDGKPKVVSEADVKEAVQKGADDLYRGLEPAGEKSAATLAEEFRTGDFFPGKGVFGNGTFTSYTSDDWGHGLYFAEKYAKKNPEGILHMSLLPEAKIAHYQVLRQEQAKALSWIDSERKTLESKPNRTLSETERLDRLQRMSYVVKDLGSFGTMRGYDAIKVPAKMKPFLNILNRTAVQVAAKG